jgi:hypothetical protein
MKTKRKAVKKFVEPWTDKSKMVDGNKNGRAFFVPIRIIRERDYQKLLKLANAK